MIVDAHAHYLPRDYPADAPACFPSMQTIRGSTDRQLVFGQMRFRAQEAFFDAEKRIEAQNASGVDVEVISPMPPLLRYDLTAADGLALARHTNEFTLELTSHAPQRLIGLGMVPMQDPEAATAELMHIKEMGLAGVEIASNIQGSSIGEQKFLEFFKEAEHLDLALFVHAMPSPMDRLPASAMGTYIVGIEGMFAAASLLLSGTAAACPNLRISFSHAAGGFPMMLPRANYFWSGSWNEEPRDLERALMQDDGPSPLESARNFYYDSMVFDRRAIRYLIELLGADRLLIGTDFPAMPREDPAAKTLKSMELPAQGWEYVSYQNAYRWLGFDQSPV